MLFDIKGSLMADVVQHQVALLNLSSTSVNYGLTSTFSFYTEQSSGSTGSEHLRSPDSASGKNSKQGEVVVGPLRGRRYSKGSDRPGFISPSAEPLVANMALTDKLKDEIRQLVALSITNLGTRTSGASKSMDQQGLESGLSFIGLVLEAGEREVAKHWASYENRDPNKREIATISYPTRWALKTTQERIDEATSAYSAAMKLPGNSVKREASKLLIEALLGNRVSTDQMAAINQEIDNSKYVTSDPDTIVLAIEQGMLSAETGAEALGFEAKEAGKAFAQHVKKLEAMQIAQTPPDSGLTGREARDEKREQREESRGTPGKQPTRGEGRRNNQD